eukprot:m.71121 g.71121  ORF g.71121 m.71121 type:complete len:65 (-) comp50162_c0_seq7:2463-2657(-)
MFMNIFPTQSCAHWSSSSLCGRPIRSLPFSAFLHSCSPVALWRLQRESEWENVTVRENVRASEL